MQTQRLKLPTNLTIERGQTQKDVNSIILEELINIIDVNAPIDALDLPCGNKEFISYLDKLYPNSNLTGADIMPPTSTVNNTKFVQMDLSKPFTLPENERYDLITSISGVMMFGNTRNFIEHCTKHLKTNGTLVITNDNSLTIVDRLSYLFLGRFRMFKPIYEDNETLTQFVPIQELIRLLRIHGIEIQDVKYTSMYFKDLIFLPIALLVYPFQAIYIGRRKSKLPKELIKSKYSFKQLLNRHYIIIGRKK